MSEQEAISTEVSERKLSVANIIFIILFSPVALITLRKGYSTKARVLSLGWMVLSILGALGNLDQEAMHNQSATNAPAKEVTAPAKKIEELTVEMADLLAAYEGNEVGADIKYKGKYIKTTGIVSGISKNVFDSIFVTLGTGKDYESPDLHSYFSDKFTSQIASLNKGQKLTIICKIDGLVIMSIQGKDCSLVSQ
jgi:hypothetical protein